MSSVNDTQVPIKAFKKGKKGKGRVGDGNGSGSGRDETSIEQHLAAERAALLAQKQTEIENVLDSHDTLVSLRLVDAHSFDQLRVGMQVRESFQLEKFVSLLLYDPAASICHFRLRATRLIKYKYRLPKWITRLYGVR